MVLFSTVSYIAETFTVKLVKFRSKKHLLDDKPTAGMLKFEVKYENIVMKEGIKLADN